MKKYILSIVIIFFLIPIVHAEVMPYYINSLKRYGIGFTYVKSPLIMRQEPSADGKILETLNFDYNGNATCLVNKKRCNIDEIFAAYKESQKIAFLTTIDETQDWALVCFNQLEKPICGWVDEKNNKFYNWLNFFEVFGKKYGLYLFKDLQKTDKILYSAPMKQSNSTGSIELPKHIVPWLIRGNWMLIKVSDFNNQLKTGYINFRGSDNKLRLFVKF